VVARADGTRYRAVMRRRGADLNIENAQLAAENAGLKRRLSWLEGKLRRCEREKAQFAERLAAYASEVKALRGQVKHFAQLLFGRKSEQGPLAGAPCSGEGPKEGAAQAGEGARAAAGEATGRAPSGRRGQFPGRPGHGRRFGRGLPTVDHPLCEDIRCGRCGTAYVPLAGAFAVSTVVDWITLVVAHRYLRQKYRRNCSCEDQPRLRTARGPQKVKPKGAFSARFLARLCIEKFGLARPANKVCQSLRLEGADLAPGTVSGLFRHALVLLLPLVREIYAYVGTQRNAHADETGYTVLDSAQQRRRWWLWVVASARAVAFLLDPHRSAEVLRTFYGWTGDAPPAAAQVTLVSDALPTYSRLAGWIRQALCWAHQRRRFRDVGRAHPAQAPWAEAWRLLIVRLYALHRTRRQAQPGSPPWLEADSALRAHVSHLRAVLEQQLCCDNLHPDQRRALVHLQQRWAGYTAFLDDPNVPLDNNLAERLLRLPVLLRKNAFFIGASRDDWAAIFAAALWSVLATAERNGLNPLSYLTAYFQACADHGGNPLEGQALARFLPWALAPEDQAAWSAPPPVETVAGIVVPVPPSPPPAARHAACASADRPGAPSSPAREEATPPAPTEATAAGEPDTHAAPITGQAMPDHSPSLHMPVMPARGRRAPAAGRRPRVPLTLSPVVVEVDSS
jgi:transposase